MTLSPTVSNCLQLEFGDTLNLSPLSPLPLGGDKRDNRGRGFTNA